MDTYRRMNIMDNNHKSVTDVVLKNLKFHINHDWLNNRQSEKYLKFENYLNITRAGYLDILKRFKVIKIKLESLTVSIDNEIEKIITE
jgi:hypothetical protein